MATSIKWYDTPKQDCGKQNHFITKFDIRQPFFETLRNNAKSLFCEKNGVE